MDKLGRTNGCLCLWDLRKLHNACTLRPRAIKQDFRKFDLARRLKELNKVLIRR
jgi:hypothetical protein